MSLDNPNADDAPLVALVKCSPKDMSDSDLSATLAELRALRTTNTTVRSKIKRSAPAQHPKKRPSINLDDLLI